MTNHWHLGTLAQAQHVFWDGVSKCYASLAQHNDALQVERYVGYSYGYALLAKHEFGYVLGKRTLYWPSITTPYRWSGMTNHELLNVRVTGPASVPHCLTQRITEVTRAYRGDGPKRHAWHGLLSPSFCALDPPSPLLFCAAVSSAFGEACRHV